MNKVRTRFAPSPTGFLHIGGVRTALFNYLYAKKHGGDFLLRIEDTDTKRSTNEAKEAIISGLQWMGLGHDESIVYQSDNIKRHKEIAKLLVDQGKAYYCYEQEAKEKNVSYKDGAPKVRSSWRDKGADGVALKSLPAPVLRLKVALQGSVTFVDNVFGEISVDHSEIEDVILLRSDGTPTYMLAVVVDDHDMAITHVIRGADHLSNTPIQKLIYEAAGWDVPEFVHVPLIHGEDGSKLSKRHGALCVSEYKNMGYLSLAMKNYLLLLGWSCNDNEVIDKHKPDIIYEAEALNLFSLEGIRRSPACFSIDKLNYINSHYIYRTAFPVHRDIVGMRIVEKDTTKICYFIDRLLPLIDDLMRAEYGEEYKDILIKDGSLLAGEAQDKVGHIISKGGVTEVVPIAMKGMQRLVSIVLSNSRTLHDVVTGLELCFRQPALDSEAKEILNSGKEVMIDFLELLREYSDEWSESALKSLTKSFVAQRINANPIKLPQIYKPLRAILTGTMASPSILVVMEALGKAEVEKRIRASVGM